MSEFCPIIKKGGAFDAFAKKYHISEGELKASIRKVGIVNPALREVSEDELLNSTEFRKLASNHYGINPSGWITSNKEHFEDVNAEFSDFKRTLSDNVQWIDNNTIYFKRDEIDQDDIDDIEYIEGIIGHENVFNRETYDGVVISFSLPRYVKKESISEKQEKPATEEKQLNNKSSVSFYEGDIEPSNNTIFVFGSNPEGRHGAGAAKIAKDKFGAKRGVGEGLTGNAYALPTKDLRIKENNGLKSISPEQIIENIKKLYETARQNPDKQFKVAYRNTDKASLNGYTGLEMIDMFLNAGPIPVNIVFSKEWVDTGKFNISREWLKDIEDEWKEATDLLHKIKDTLGKRVRKSDNFKKDHTYYILNPQTGTWERHKQACQQSPKTCINVEFGDAPKTIWPLTQINLTKTIQLLGLVRTLISLREIIFLKKV